MKMPFAWISLGFLAGLVLSRLLDPVTTAWLNVAAVAGLGIVWLLRGHRYYLPALGLQWVVLGMLLAGMRHSLSEDSVPVIQPAACASVEGIVRESPKVFYRGRFYGAAYVLMGEQLMTHERGCPETRGAETAALLQGIRIRSIRQKIYVQSLMPAEVPLAGERVRVFGSLHAPRGAKNPGEWDWARHLAEREITIQLTGSGTAALQRIGAGNTVLFQIQRMRRALAEIFEARSRQTAESRPWQFDFFSHTAPRVFQALLIGDRSRFPKDLTALMTKTGTSHLISISGLHITLVAGSFFLIGLALGKARWQCALTACTAALIYAAVAGADPPVVRSAVMAVFFYFAAAAERSVRTFNIFFLAMGIVLILAPLSWKSISFQLTFLSVFSLLWLRVPAGLERHFWVEPLWSSLAALAGTAPLVLWYFQNFSIVSPLANLWAIPFFNAALLGALMFLAAAPLGAAAAVFYWPAALGLRAGLWGLEILAHIPFSSLTLPKPSGIQLLLYYGFGILWRSSSFGETKSALRVWIRRGAAAGWILAMLSFFVAWGRPQFGATFFDAQPLGIVHISRGGQDWLLLPAGRYAPGLVKRTLGPYLKSRGVRTLEIILTDYGCGQKKAIQELTQDFSIRLIHGPPSKKVFNFFKNSGSLRPSQWRRLAVIRSGELSITPNVKGSPQRLRVDYGSFRLWLEGGKAPHCVGKASNWFSTAAGSSKAFSLWRSPRGINAFGGISETLWLQPFGGAARSYVFQL